MKNWINSVICVVAIVIAFLAMAKAAPARELDFDYIGAVIGVLSFLVTLLIGYQIYTVINVKEELKEVQKLKDEIDTKLKEKGEEVTNEYKSELQKAIPVILAIASSKPEIIEREVFKTYMESKTGQLAKELAEQAILTILIGCTSSTEDSSWNQNLEELAKNVKYEEVIAFYTDYAKSDTHKLPKNIEKFLLELIDKVSQKKEYGDTE